MANKRLEKNYLLQVNHGDGEITTFDVNISLRGANDSRINVKYSCTDNNITPGYRGKTVAKLKDHGNGIKIKLERQTINLDYDEAEELMAILKLHNEDKDISLFRTTYRKYIEVEIE